MKFSESVAISTVNQDCVCIVVNNETIIVSSDPKSVNNSSIAYPSKIVCNMLLRNNTIIVIIAAIMLHWGVDFTVAETYYVLPSPHTPCPPGEGGPCLTLSQYAFKPNSYFSLNTTMILLPGNHTLSQNFSLFQHDYVAFLTNDTLLEPHQSLPVVITCINGANLQFLNINTVFLQELNTVGCENGIVSVEKFTLINSRIQGQNKSGTGLVINGVDEGNIVNTHFVLNTEGSFIPTSDADFILSAGGAVIIHNSRVIIQDCFFLNNSVTAVPVIMNSTRSNQTVVNIVGGAVSIQTSYVTINNSLFLYNSANKSCLMSHNGNKMKCSGAGGALFVEQSSLQVIDSVFTSNTAFAQGGTIAAINSNISIRNCQMTCSEAPYGGVFYIIGTNASIDDSDMSHNTHSLQGAVMYVAKWRDSTRVTFNNCTFSNNQADFGSSIVMFFHSYVTINSSTFYKNKALSTGGVVYAQVYCTLDVQSSSFENNTADSAGVISVSDGTKATIQNSHFHGNTVEIFGGVLVGVNNSSITITASVFVGNRANIAGGALYVESFVVLDLHNNVFDGNRASRSGGVLYAQSFVTLDLTNNVFDSNAAMVYGGALFLNISKVKIRNNQFRNNIAINDSCYITSNHETFADRVYEMDTICGLNDNNKSIAVGIGGVMFAISSTLVIETSTFTNNAACNYGGIGYFESSTVMIYNSIFQYNQANCSGGALYILMGKMYTEGCTFQQNTALRGGALQNGNAYVSMVNCKMLNNTGYFYGGAIQCVGERTQYGPAEIVLQNTTISYNLGIRSAGAMSLYVCTITSKASLDIHNNTGGVGVIMMFQSIARFEGMSNIANNFGSVYAVDSTVTFTGISTLKNNSPYNSSIYNITDTLLYAEGGAMTMFKSNLNIMGTMTVKDNQADNGGAILVIESTLNKSGIIFISNNTAITAGGGIYAYQSVLMFRGNSSISNNTALVSGGAIHAASASVEVSNGTFGICNNHAKQGGGIFLELSSHFYVLKYWIESLVCNNPTSCNTNPSKWTRVKFVSNSADYGGAIFVKDGSNSDTCDNMTPKQSVPTKECFYQNLAVNYNSVLNTEGIHVKNTIFTRNTASIAGNTLYGGLLDRCIVSPFSEHFTNVTWFTPVYYFRNITNAKLNSMSSDPVRVCFCRGQEYYDCGYRPPTLQVVKGKTFTISTVAVDQVNRTVPSTITCSLSSQGGGLSEGETRQNTTSGCTELKYTLFSPNPSEMLDLYANGPCKDIGISKFSLNVEFLPCPIGFKLGQSNSSCICDPDLKPYITNCSLKTNSLFRKGDFWIDHVADGYLKYPHCPFDYCYPPTETVAIDLNNSSGADSQCAHNRSGKLCGKCQPKHSLLLGGTRCSKCSNTWLLLFVPFSLAGITLVVFLLVLNLTVAVGTIGSLAFYANIIAANYSTFFPFGKPTFASVFISWLNLDFGFETCFYDGMDAYTKTWLQFVFPIYIIFLVVAIIVISDYSDRFARLFTESGRNPIATLATLILLSYTKLLRTVIDALSFTRLNYPNGTQEIVWLLDANVMYLHGKHTPLFIVAIFTAVVGLTYTLILSFWQVLLRCPTRFILLRWMTNTKLLAFIDAHHAPYDERHRYWTGMLLLLRTVIYLVSAVNVLGDPRVNLVSIICVVGFILTLQAFLPQKPLRTVFCNVLELVSHFNLFMFTILTLYLKDSNGNTTVLEYTSACIAFGVFVVVILYHVTLFTHFGLELVRNVLSFIITFRHLGQRNRELQHLPIESASSSFPNLHDAPSVTEINANPSILNSTTQDMVTTSGNSITQDGSSTVHDPQAQDSEEDSDVSYDGADDETEPLLKV